MQVSILLPTYNGNDRIDSSINSVLKQRFKDWELLILDDGSTSPIQINSNDQRIKIIRTQNNLGIQKTLNRGLKIAQGEFIARIDDDDEWTDECKLSKQIDYFARYPKTVLLGTGAITVNENGHKLAHYKMPENDLHIRKRLLFKNCFLHPTVMFKKDVALSVGGYDESEKTKHLEDYDLWFKLGKIGKLANLGLISTSLKQSKTSISGSKKNEQLDKHLALMDRYKFYYPGYTLYKPLSHLRKFTNKTIPKSVLTRLLSPYKQW